MPEQAKRLELVEQLELLVGHELDSAQNLSVAELASMSLSYLVLGDLDKALSKATEAIQRHPTKYDGYRLMGTLLKFQGKPQDAIKQFTTAAGYASGPELVSVLTSRSDAYAILGDWKAALSDTERGLQLVGNDTKTAARINPSLLLNHCYALTHLGKTESALEMVREVLPLLEDAYFRAVAFAILGDKEQMLKSLKSSIKEDRINVLEARYDPNLAAYHEDADFQELLRAGSHAPKKD